MTDPINSVDNVADRMADVVRGPSGQAHKERLAQAEASTGRYPPRALSAANVDARHAVAPPTSPTLAQVLQAYDEILKRLESAKIQSDELRQAMTRATLPNQPKQASISDLEGGTIFDQLAARAVMLSRVAEEIEHNLALSLSAMR